MIGRIHPKISVTFKILILSYSFYLFSSNLSEAANTCTPAKIKENIGKIQDSNNAISVEATYSVARCGSKSIQSIIQTLQQDQNPTIRIAAASALIYMGDTAKGAIPQLIETLRQDRDPNVRMSAADTLGKMKDSAQAAIPQLIISLKQDRDANVRSSAASALGNIKNTGASIVPQLILSLKQDKDPNVRSNAASALGKMGDAAKSAVPQLIASLKTDLDIRKNAADALGKMGTSARVAIPQLITLLKDEKDPDIRRNAADALGKMGASAQVAIPQLIQTLQQDRDPHIRSAIATALGSMAESAKMTVPQLITALRQDRDPNVRRSAADALRNIASHLQEKKDRLSPGDLEIAQNALNAADFFAFEEKVQICWPGKFSQEQNILCLKYFHIKTGLILWLIHASIWLGLICIYHKYTQVQRIFFWHPWLRKILGFGYVGLAITKIPCIRFHLLSPFKDSLLADADLERFDSQHYFSDVEFNLKINEREQIPQKPTPSRKFRIVIEGEAGVGKSMFLRYLAKHSQRNIVYLPAFKCQGGVMEAIEDKLPISHQDPKFLHNLIKNRALDIYIDGFSEMKPHIRVEIASFVKNYPNTNFIIATHPLDWLPSSHIKTYILQPLKPQQIEDFLLSRHIIIPGNAPISGENYQKACQNYLATIFHQEQSGKITIIQELSNPMKLTAIAEMIANCQEGGVGFGE